MYREHRICCDHRRRRCGATEPVQHQLSLGGTLAALFHADSSVYLGAMVFDCDLHIAIRILLLAKTLEGRLDLDEESPVCLKGGLVCRVDLY